MKTRDLLAIHVMRAVIGANPDLIKSKSSDDGSDVSAALDIFKEARGQIQDRFDPESNPFDDDWPSGDDSAAT